MLGLIVFLAGILLLAGVFFEARALLERPLSTQAAAAAFEAVRQIGLLFIMGYVASSLAARGSQFYLAARPDSVEVEPAVPD